MAHKQTLSSSFYAAQISQILGGKAVNANKFFWGKPAVISTVPWKSFVSFLLFADLRTERMESTTSFNETTTSIAVEKTSPMEVITSTNAAVEKIRDFHVSSARMDLGSRAAATAVTGLEARIPPFNIAQLLHGHRGQTSPAPTTGPGIMINHPNFVQENLTDNNHRGDRNPGNVILNMFRDGDMEAGFATAGIAIFVTVLILGVFCVLRRKKRLSYAKIPSSSDVKRYEYFYRPSNGNSLDDEYENTFVGVSVPLLHEVTKI